VKTKRNNKDTPTQTVADDGGNPASDLELKQYQDRLRSLAIELAATEARERRQIAEYLHDNIGQSLAVIKLRLEALRVKAQDPAGRKSVEEITTLVSMVIADIRSLTYEVSPPILNELGLGPAIEWLGERLASNLDLNIKVNQHDKVAEIDDAIGAMLFRAVGELVTNVAKHAKAKNVVLNLGITANSLYIEVADDGIGFVHDSAQVIAKGGFGLFSIKERVEFLGGSMVINSVAGKGAKVILEIPKQALKSKRVKKGLK